MVIVNSVVKLPESLLGLLANNEIFYWDTFAKTTAGYVMENNSELREIRALSIYDDKVFTSHSPILGVVKVSSFFIKCVILYIPRFYYRVKIGVRLNKP